MNIKNKTARIFSLAFLLVSTLSIGTSFNSASLAAVNGELARTDLNTAIAINPDSAEYYLKRGVLYLQDKKWELALADFNTAIKIKPDYAEAYLFRGNIYNDERIYSKQKKLELALADFNTAIRIKPDFAEAYFARGGYYISVGNKQKAIEDWQQAAQLYKMRGDTNAYKAFTNILDLDDKYNLIKQSLE
ncbi:tetratricopeptide repeat protein [Anabaena sp. UHCC 0253]|uniref:tetratricopeptide repeat protein n=1 Tax=Anabaena sp. UHCC 0253 TaxID=2590019 RepID=UPI0014467791|nr:tetratricopeptide repeat protein [Anabaena sp. UHCC 0253]MTJ55845.1 tetratricopeptide repeat protein [Anabaena sp. UHCC 0253]